MSAGSVVVLSCVLLCVCAGVPSDRGGKSGDKKLKNVIITSFGELPYEPMESGFYSADVIPVNFEDEIKNPTMDVALRTGILVEDPNEKKKSSVEDEASLTNPTLQVSDDEDFGDKKETDVDYLSPRVKNEYRKTKSETIKQEITEKYIPSESNYGYEVRKTRRPKVPQARALDHNGWNINTEYFGDLGEGWNLQDAEEVLRGRNYNILTQTTNTYPQTYPVPPPREIPPPFVPPNPRQPMFYPLPPFNYKPFPRPMLGPHRGSAALNGKRDYDGDESRQIESRDQPQEGSNHTKDVIYGRRKLEEHQPRGRTLPFSKDVFYSEDYLRGI